MDKRVAAFLGASILILTSCAKSDAGSAGSLSSQDSQPGIGDDAGQQQPPIETPAVDPTEFIPSFPADSQTFNSPWSRRDTAIVIDAYEGNAINWDRMQTDERVIAVIHRASSGLRVDSKYLSRERTAKQLGYLWGAYHLGTSGDPIAQAKLFLQTVGTDPSTLMFLDLEDTSNPKMMNIPNAVLFMNYVYQQTGKIPVVYANQSVMLALNAAVKTNVLFKQARLWYARFKSKVTDFPIGIWSSYFLWQFSSEINCSATGHCLYNVPGTSFDMDINVFYGTPEALASQWH